MAGPILAPILYRKRAIVSALVDSATDTADRIVYTFTGRSFGPEAPGRKILILVEEHDGGGPLTVTDVTIGGITATLLKVAAGLGSGVNINMAFAIASVPTGTTGDVTVTFNGAADRCAVGIYRLIGAEGTVYAEGTNSSNPFQASLDIPSGGAAFGIGGVATTEAFTITNLTKDASGTLEGNGYAFASAMFASTQTGLTIGFTQAVANGAAAFITMGPA